MSRFLSCRLAALGLTAGLATLAATSGASAATYGWFYGTGDTAGGVFSTDGAGKVVSGSGVFNTSLGTMTASIAPGAGADGSFAWDNQYPVDLFGLLFRNPSNSLETNLFPNTGSAGLGVTPNVTLAISPSSGVYPVEDHGTLTIIGLGGSTYEWFYGTGDTAGGVFNTDGAGNVVSGSGVFNTSLGAMTASIAPGSGADGSFVWDNQYPVDLFGLLFRNPSNTLEANLFPNTGSAGLGVTPDVTLAISPSGGVYPVVDQGTLTITAMGVPEPATWALMLVGFGGLGVALRSRRKLGTVAA